ncbi:MAG: hypothetical protein MUF15_03975 [Acidobacteria bacterium]|jgi:hypothetical protein|nr:hypothetical protein [Acidobacteriota bacterium]
MRAITWIAPTYALFRNILYIGGEFRKLMTSNYITHYHVVTSVDSRYRSHGIEPRNEYDFHIKEIEQDFENPDLDEWEYGEFFRLVPIFP